METLVGQVALSPLSPMLCRVTTRRSLAITQELQLLRGWPAEHGHHANRTTDQFNYDNAAKLTQVWSEEGSNSISRHTYTLDAVGNCTSVAEVLPQLGAPGPIAGGLTGTPPPTYAATGQQADLAWSSARHAGLPINTIQTRNGIARRPFQVTHHIGLRFDPSIQAW